MACFLFLCPQKEIFPIFGIFDQETMVLTRSCVKNLTEAKQNREGMETVLTRAQRRQIESAEASRLGLARRKKLIGMVQRWEKERSRVLRTAYEIDGCSICGTDNMLEVTSDTVGYDCETCGVKTVLWQIPWVECDPCNGIYKVLIEGDESISLPESYGYVKM